MNDWVMKNSSFLLKSSFLSPFLFSNINLVCDWNGIKCDEDSGLVITIDLTEAHLDGTLPDEIGKLSSLKQIIISEVSNILMAVLHLMLLHHTHFHERDKIETE